MTILDGAGKTGAVSLIRPCLQTTVLFVTIIGFLGTAHSQNQPELIQDDVSYVDDINYFSPIGQSFTSVANGPVSVELYYMDYNSGMGPNSLTVNLSGATGRVGSAAITLPDGFQGFYPAYFPRVNLTAGAGYLVTVVAPTPRWGVGFSQFNPYNGGSMMEKGSLIPFYDLGFRVIPLPALNVSCVSNQVALYWPAWGTNWVLESSTNLWPSNWLPVTNAVSIIGGVTLPKTLSSMYFRLRRSDIGL